MITPYLMTSANPVRHWRGGNVFKNDGSSQTSFGCQKAPTKFFPSGRSTPVFPPMAASAMPSSVVGTETNATPRMYVAARNPARSVTTPPPNATMAERAIEPRARDAPVNIFEGAQILGVFPIRKDLDARNNDAGGKIFEKNFQMTGCDDGARRHHEDAIDGQTAAKFFGKARYHRSNANIIRPVFKADGNGFHDTPIETNREISSTTLSNVRPSVATA